MRVLQSGKHPVCTIEPLRGFCSSQRHRGPISQQGRHHGTVRESGKDCLRFCARHVYQGLDGEVHGRARSFQVWGVSRWGALGVVLCAGRRIGMFVLRVRICMHAGVHDSSESISGCFAVWVYCALEGDLTRASCIYEWLCLCMLMD